MSGIFIEDQVRALARRRPGWQLAVSNWGQDETVFELRRPFRSAVRVLRQRRRGTSTHHIEANAALYAEPVVHWTPRLFSGRVDAIVQSNRANFERARRDFCGIDLIHAHAAFPAGLIAARLAREVRVPYVLTEHSGDSLRTRLERTAIGRASAGASSEAAALIVVSNALRLRLARSGIEATDVIPNVVDETFFTPPEDAPALDRPRVFTLGRLVEGKGIGELLQALAELRRSGLSIDLRIGGEGPRRLGWEAHANELGLAGDVTFLGGLTRESVRTELQQCSCFVSASESETFGVVCIEALACGRPVVATRSGGPEDIVHEGNGILVPTHDVAALAAAIGDVLARVYDPEAIRSNALRRFGSEAVVSALEAVYHRVAGDRLREPV